MDKLTEELLKEFDEIGFGNQARIVGVKRVELKDFLRSRIDTLLQKEREAGKREAYQNCVDWTKQVQPYNQEAINAHSAAVSQMDWELKSQTVEKSNSLQE